MFHAVFLMTLGVLLLLNNFQVLSWNIWQNILPFWPVLIIFAGVDVVFGRSNLGRIISGVINSIIFLAIIARVVGFNLPIIKNIPLPKNNTDEIQQLFFTKEHRNYSNYF